MASHLTAHLHLMTAHLHLMTAHLHLMTTHLRHTCAHVTANTTIQTAWILHTATRQAFRERQRVPARGVGFFVWSHTSFRYIHIFPSQEQDTFLHTCVSFIILSLLQLRCVYVAGAASST